MKKKITAIILVLCLVLSCFSGCTLVSQDQSKVLAQAVVTIGTGDNAEEITMSDVITNYNNIYYIYVYYLGYSEQQVLDYVIDGLTTQAAFRYAAMEVLPVVNTSSVTYSYEKYLTSEEIAEVVDSTNKIIAADIDAIEIENLQESYTASGYALTEFTVRTTPDWADTSSVIPADFTGNVSRSVAYAEFVRTIESAGYTYDEMYQLMYRAYLQAKITEKYQELILEGYEYSFEDLQVKYNSQLASELEYYSAYGLDSYMDKYDTDSDSIIYNPSGEEMGYVSQILIPFSDEQLAMLDGLEGDELTAMREQLATEAVAYDLRTSYLLTYGYTTDGDGLFSRYDFDGTVTPDTTDGVQTRDEQGNFSYSEIVENEYVGVDEFLSSVVNPYLDGSVVGSANGYDIYSSAIDIDAFEDLVYAYNADDGVLGVEYGYLIPNDSFYEEFNAAAEALFDYGVGSYTVCVTDYGYHIVYLTKYIPADETRTLVESETTVAGTFSYEFATLFTDTAQTAYFNLITTDICEEYTGDEYVTLNQSVYDSLIAMLG